MSKVILAIDPGDTTGFARVAVDGTTMELLDSGEFEWGDIVDFIANQMLPPNRPDLVLIELVNPRHIEVRAMTANWVTGAALVECDRAGIEKELRSPTYLKKGRLLMKTLGWKAKSPHVSDSIAHALVYVVMRSGNDDLDIRSEGAQP